MSLLDYLNHNLRRSTLYCWAASSASIVVLAADRQSALFKVALILCGIFWVVAFSYSVRVRCPRCRNRLLSALPSFGILLRLPAWYKSCPACGFLFKEQQDLNAKT